MSTLSRDMTKPMAALGGLAYLAALSLALFWWHLDPDVVLTLTVGGIGLLVMALRPVIGIHAFIMLMYVADAFTTGSDITGMKIIGGVILAGWMMSMAVRRGAGIPFNAMSRVMLLFVLWCAVASIYAFEPSVAYGRVFSYAQLAISALMFCSVIDDTAKMRRVFGAMTLWTCLSTIIALVFYYAGVTRVASGLTGNRNLLAHYVTSAIICAYLLYQVTPSVLPRLLLVAVLPVFFVGLALTFSRTGMIVLIVALLVVWYRVAKERRYLLLVASIMVLSIIGLLLPSTFWQRAASIVPAVRYEKETFGLRVRLWKVGLRMIEDHPIAGVGPGNFAYAFRRYARGEVRDVGLIVHNTYVGVAAEQGVIGLGLFVLLLLLGLRETRLAIRVGDVSRMGELGLLAVVVEANLLVTMVIGLSGNIEGFKLLWIFLGLALGLGQLARRRPTEQASG